MMKGRYENRTSVRKQNRSKRFALLISLLLLAVVAVGGTVAYLMTDPATVTNQFVPGKVEIAVNDDYTVTMTENSNVAGFIRATVLVNWMDSSGNVYAFAPTGYTIEYGENWAAQSDGYYYYSMAVEPSHSTTALIKNIALPANVADIPTGYEFTVEILAEVIQAKGGAGHTAADWGKAPTN